MSKDNLDQDNALPTTTAAPERRRATIPEIVKQQQSFEKRYSNIIQKQILETSINMEALHRQMNAFLSFSKSPPKSFDIETKSDKTETSATTENPVSDESQSKDSTQLPQQSTKEPIKVKPFEKHFEKAATVDIVEHSAMLKK